ncbi:malto-oligosyltrehalose trehalohydrolase [Tundrisphaera lichenicola]|uniref:malto-oligosyltrehalose trehalohydrolase n=1 Tax=Tundrisphaera lichenicola TaxID=2029860 RepID=UPI003EBAE835
MIDDPEIPPAGVIELDAETALFRVWAPRAEKVELILGSERSPMTHEPRGFFAIDRPMPDVATRYGYSLDGVEPQPDPASRWQPEGINLPSAVFFPGRMTWDEGNWSGIERHDLVIYELHVGTFTREGTFEAVIPRLAELRDLGITAIELMPVGQFPGSRSWGYDGVFPFAVQNSYGGPEGLKGLVEACHKVGLAVILDAIFNHFGPEGNVLPRFGDYLTSRYKTDWGDAINFDDRRCDPVRAMVLDNVRMWIGEYRFDGLRLDAADQIFDRGPRHILADIAEVAHREAARLGRKAHVFAETDQNDAPRYLKPTDRGGYGLDGHWTDDFHHAAHTTLTGEINGYYQDFADGPASLARAYSRIFVNDGRYSPFRERRHGTDATEFLGDRFVAFTQNHDQVGNRIKSDRYAASLPPEAVRLAAGILLLAPRLPLIFMGQEYGETNPFPFFCDFQDPALIEAVREGRKKEFAYFGWKDEPTDPFALSTRDSAVLSWSWSDSPRDGLRNLYRDLLRLRRECPALRDFRHPDVRLLEEEGSPKVMEVIRRPKSGDPVKIYLNLGPEPFDLPGGLVEDAPALRSESETYGGPLRLEKTNPMTLGPWEFALFGPVA